MKLDKILSQIDRVEETTLGNDIAIPDDKAAMTKKKKKKKKRKDKEVIDKIAEILNDKHEV